MNNIVITRVVSNTGRVEVYYKANGAIAEYLNDKENCFWCEYSEDISGTPQSIAVIPFVCNVLPIVWITDAELIVPELDLSFYESTFDIKHGYILQSPQIHFKGLLTVNKLVKNNYQTSNRNVVLFSGGVDAFATLFAHIDEKPQLITLRGSDVKLSDVEGWNVVSKQVEEVADTFGLSYPKFITTNFRLFLEEGKLGKFTSCLKDGWWHAIQHGIGIIGHTAPLAFKYKYNRIYIASSYTVDCSPVCASDPVIDSMIRFGSSIVRHDRYCMDRIQKVRLIVDTCNKLDKKIQLRVCWVSAGGHNCCRCEKCIRTIFNILAVGGNPKEFGFYDYEKYCSSYEEIIKKYLLDEDHLKNYWMPIKKYFCDNKDIIAAADSRFSWILRLDVYAKRPLKERAHRALGSMKYRVCKLLRLS